jgi:hypothetical protein
MGRSPAYNIQHKYQNDVGKKLDKRVLADARAIVTTPLVGPPQTTYGKSN